MGRISERFRALAARGERALVPFVTGGDPDLPTTEALVLALERGGADAVEIGVPFSDPILLAAPTTRPARLAMLAKETRGFLYFVSLTGVTGARQSLSATLEREVRAVREVSDIPVCVGFGVSTPEQARDVARFADGVAVGSALIDRIERAASPEQAVEAAGEFVAALKAPLRGPF